MRHHQQIHRPRLSISKDVYDQMVSHIQELELESRRLNNEIFELRKLDVETFFSWLRDRSLWTHDDQFGETIIRISDKSLHDKFQGGA